MTPEQKIIIEQLLEMGDVTYIKSDSSRKELIVKAISAMDLEQLEILTENYLSEDKREEFLKVIKSKFNKFKVNNDTHLIAHSGSCNGSWCDNYGTLGYSFTGNISNTFYNLIFEEVNGECSDICKCSRFKINDKTINEARENERKKELDSYNFTDEELDDLPF